MTANHWEHFAQADRTHTLGFRERVLRPEAVVRRLLEKLPRIRP